MRRLLGTALGIVLAAAAPRSVAAGSAWTQIVPTASDLSEVWGSGPNDVFAVGEEGTIVHYDGSAWTTMSSGTTRYLNAVWGLGPDEVVAVGGDFDVLRYDGTSWSTMPQPGVSLYTVWGTSLQDLYAAGKDVWYPGGRAVVYHYNGSAWTRVSTGPQYSETIHHVWGTGSSDVFAVGPDILHYDGSAWLTISTERLYAVWGTEPNYVIGVRYDGGILLYNGVSWSEMTSHTGNDLVDVWGSARDDVFAVGFAGTIVHYDGSSWSVMASPTPSDLSGVWGSGPCDVYAVGLYGNVLHFAARLLKCASPDPELGQVSWSPEPVLLNPVRYSPGTPVSLTATAADGKSFMYWRLYDPNHPGDANFATSDANNPITIAMDTDREVGAEFGPVGMGLVSQTATSGFADFVTVAGNHAFVAADIGGLQIFDVSDPNQPAWVGQCATTQARRVALSGQHAYVADMEGGLKVIDVSDPCAPTCVGELDTDGSVYAVALAGFLAYLADGLGGLEVVDVSNPKTPVRIGGYNTPCRACGVALLGSHALVADGPGGLTVIDVSDPNAPTWVNRCLLTNDAVAVSLGGSIAYVASGTGGLEIVDVSDANSPTRIGGCRTGGIAREVPVAGNCVFMMDGPSGVELIDVSDPGGPVWKGRYDAACYPYGGCVVGRLAYVAGGSGGLVILELPLRGLSVGIAGGTAPRGHVTLEPVPSDANQPLFLAGTEVELTGVADERRCFLRWEVYDPNHPGDANYVMIDTNNPVAVTMDGDQQVTAVFGCGTGVEQALPLLIAGACVLGMAVRRRLG